MTLTKADLRDRLVEKLNIESRDAADLVDDFFQTLRNTLSQGQEVKLSSFGNFEIKDKRERPGRNPKTGEAIPVTARRVVTFKPSNTLKERVYSLNDQVPATEAKTKPKKQGLRLS